MTNRDWQRIEAEVKELGRQSSCWDVTMLTRTLMAAVVTVLIKMITLETMLKRMAMMMALLIRLMMTKTG